MKTIFQSLFLLLCCSFAGNAQSQDVALVQGEKMMQNYQSAFEENKGQVTGDDAAKVNFVYKDKGLSVFLLHTGIAYQFNQTHYPDGYKHLDKFAQPEEREKMEELAKNIRTETYRMDVELLGANPNPRITTDGKSQDYTQYYNHNALNVHNYSKITYHEVYPNIDWVIYKTDKALKYDFVVHKGGNPAQIQLKTHWVEDLQLNADGGITLKNRMGNITEQSPVSFQADKAISTQFKLENNVLSFAIANYDPNQTLIIDPSIAWATYYGGSSSDYGVGTSTDASGNVYLVGTTLSSTAIAAGGHDNIYGANGWTDAFLVKFNSAGTRLWGTYYGGSSIDEGTACAVDASGNVYVTGLTVSSTGVFFNGFQSTLNPAGFNSYSDAFLVKFNSNGVRLWGTYYGGAWPDKAHSCAVDPSGNVYIAGETNSDVNIASGGHQNTHGNTPSRTIYDAFLVKFNPNGGRLWATYYGGTGHDNAYACATDASGNVYLAGQTASYSDIGSGGHQNTKPSGLSSYDGFLVKFNSNGVRQWGTYYGANTEINACVADPSNNIYIIGRTSSSLTIASSGHQNTFGGFYDAFAAKFNSSGVRQWGTYYGGSGYDVGLAGSYNAQSNFLYVSGQTESTTNIAFNAVQNTNGGGIDAFVVCLSSTGVRQWGSYFGGTGDDQSFGISTGQGPREDIYIAGTTLSSSNIAVNGHQSIFGGVRDAFLTQYSCRSFTFLSQQICQGQSYIYRGDTLDITGLYRDTFVNAAGCDSIVTLNLMVNPPTSATITQASCTSFTLNGTTYTSSGTYTQNRTNAAGCDSTITLNLTINQPTSATITQASCTNFTLNGTTYTSSGTYTQTRTNAAGCDSTITLNLTIKQPTTATITQASCSNFTLNGTTYTSSGTYTQNRTNAAGCDSTITLNLTINQPTSATITQASCTNFTLNGTTYTSSGTYTQNRTNAAGCDSTITLNLTINQPTSATITQASCSNFTLNGTTYTSSGTYTQTRTNAAGCDSTITLNLTINQPTSATITQASCTSFTLNGTTYTASGTYTQNRTNAAGCDSTITLNLTINQPTSATITQASCTSFTLNGTTYTSSGAYTQNRTNAAGCDSTITLNLTINQPTTATITQASCTSFTLNGTTYTSSGTYTQNRTNAAGCDSTITLNLTINQPTTATITQASCSNFTLNGTTYTSSGTYTQNRTNAAGCDSTITLNLTINQPTSATITQASCTSFTLNGTTYTASGTYTQNRTNAAGCDSTITLNLTINQPTSAIITQASCTSFMLNGTTYTSSGTYTQNRSNAAGCDSTITLNLTINQPTSATITQASCSNFTLNGTTYTSSGTYTQNRTNAAGCDSTITLNLTINAQSTVTITQSGTTLQATAGYVSYLWSLNGTIISGATTSSHIATANGDYEVTVTDANGCQNTSTINYTASNIGEISSADYVKIFPNPSEGIVNINFTQSGAKNINIYDNLGRLIYQNSTQQIENQIYLHDLPSGVYQIQIIQANAQITKSLIIAK